MYTYVPCVYFFFHHSILKFYSIYIGLLYFVLHERITNYKGELLRMNTFS